MKSGYFKNIIMSIKIDQLPVKYNSYLLMRQEEIPNPEFQINHIVNFQPCFETNANCFSQTFFIWTHELIKKGYKKPLQMDDLSDLRKEEEPSYSASKFKNIFYSFPKRKKGKLLSSFKRYLGFNFCLAGILFTIASLLQFSGPLVIGKILNFLSSPNPDINEGLVYVSILVGCYLIRVFILQHSMKYMNLSCVQVLNSANFLIYKKILNLSSAARKYLEAGTITNNINVDLMSFYQFIWTSTYLFSGPVMIGVAVALLIYEVGWIGAAAPVLFLFGMLMQQKLMTMGFVVRKDQLFWSDKRSKCVNQYFSGIRIIKYYGWENLVANKIENIRKEELILNYKTLMIRTYVEILLNMLPILSSIIIFSVYVFLEGEQSITPAKVYTVLSIFNLMAIPMRILVLTLIFYMNSKASLRRIDHFLEYQEKNQEGFEKNDESLEKGDIMINQAKFNWETQKAKKHFQKGKFLEGGKTKNDKQASKRKKKEKARKKYKKNKILSQNNLREDLLQDEIQEQTTEPEALSIDLLKIAKGQFVAVVGSVGSGKSTLLSAILGEIDKVSGTVNRRGTIAYIPQISWLRSATIRENILFQTPYDQERYEQIINICELKSDLEILGGGDLTEIGEKGVNLSGGQKQRISIARALYHDADIYLIDDCLSALDAYVGKSIFTNVLKGYLQREKKTIIFVTNAIDYTDLCDRVLVMKNGKIVEDDHPRELKSSGVFYKELKVQLNKEEEQERQKQKEIERRRKKENEDTITIESEDREMQKQRKAKKIQALVKVEQRLKGKVSWMFYYRFFTGPGKFASVLMFLFIVLSQLARVASDWWLGEWSTNVFNIPNKMYIYIYGGISVVVGMLMYLKGIFFAKFIVNSSKVIQRKFIKVLLRSPLSWFDVTPTGRILARTTKDQDDLDNTLSFNIQNTVQNILVMFSSILLICVATPIYFIVAVITLFVYYKLVKMYMSSSRELKRLEANTRAPLISHIEETIAGMYLIRAFEKEENFVKKYFSCQKQYIAALVNQNIASRWINLVTDIFSTVSIAAAGYLGVITILVDFGGMDINLIGLALTWSLQMSSILSFTLRLLADTESNMNAVVRLYDYIDNNPKEKDFDQPPPRDDHWPNRGVFQIDKISYKYRPELPLVIKNISFDIKENAKIGIVGRTGSGKSTMTLGLLRILEVAENSDNSIGSINLDGEDISEIGLHHLRHKVSIIPQDPTLFTGTIRSNMDPFDEYSDEQIAECLKKVKLWDQIKKDPEEEDPLRQRIYSKIDEGGSNFSLGQRQLICMGRALIKHPKVLLMDEATASIDEKTDETIQSMIRQEFKSTTVITIAHRLNTIIFYDKILVLDNGEIKEYDTPLNLVENPNTFLGKLIRKTGKGFAEKIIEMASKYQ